MAKKIIPIDESKERDFSWKEMSFPVEVISTKSDAGLRSRTRRKTAFRIPVSCNFSNLHNDKQNSNQETRNTYHQQCCCAIHLPASRAR